MTRHVHTVDQVDAISKRAKPRQLSTTRLTSNDLDETQALGANLDTTNWLALLMAPPNVTQSQTGTLPPPQPAPSGMIEHLRPPRMAPTIGSRLTTGLRRTILLTALAALATSALAAGAYVVASTAWLSTLLSSPAPATQPATTTGAPASGSTGATGQPDQPQPVTRANSQPPAQSQSRPPAPGDTAAIQLRDKGIQQYKAGDFSASIATLESSVTIDGADAVSYYQLGLAYMAVTGREHSLEDAELTFRTAISLQPTWAAPHQLLAESLLRRGFYNEAIAPATQATKLDPTQSDSWLTLGRAYQGAGQPAQAQKAFAEAARRAPYKK